MSTNIHRIKALINILNKAAKAYYQEGMEIIPTL